MRHFTQKFMATFFGAKKTNLQKLGFVFTLIAQHLTCMYIYKILK